MLEARNFTLKVCMKIIHLLHTHNFGLTVRKIVFNIPAARKNAFGGNIIPKKYRYQRTNGN